MSPGEWPRPSVPIEEWHTAGLLQVHWGADFCCTRHRDLVQKLVRPLQEAVTTAANRAQLPCDRCRPAAVVWQCGSVLGTNGWYKGEWLGSATAIAAIEAEWRDVCDASLRLQERNLARKYPKPAVPEPSLPEPES